MNGRQPIPIQFPLKGIVRGTSYAEQPDGSCYDALNVRPYDSLEKRKRGGQRTGISKYFAAQVNGSASVQLAQGIVEAVELSESAGFGDKFSNPSGASAGNFGFLEWHPDSDHLAYGTSGSTNLDVWPFDGTAFSSSFELTHATIAGVLGGTPDKNDIAWHPSGNYLFIAASTGLGVWPFSKTTGFGTGAKLTGSTGCVAVAVSPDGNAVIYADGTGTRVHAVAFSGGAFGSALSDPGTGAAAAIVDECLAIDSTGTLVFACGSSTIRAWPFNSATGFSAPYSDPATPIGTSPFQLVLYPEAAYVLVLNGTNVYIYPFNSSTGWGAVTTTAHGLTTARSLGISTAGDFISIGHGASPYIKVYPFTGSIGTAVADPASTPGATVYDVKWNTDDGAIAVATGADVQAWAWSGDRINPSARESRVVAVAGGSVFRSDTELTTLTVCSSGSGALRVAGAVAGTPAFQKFFFCDGLAANYKYLDFSDNTVKAWTPSAGSLPVGSTDTTLACRMIALYRGRIVLSGLKEDPQNWYMSAVDDPLDWDYSPATTTATQAVAGNNSDAGLLGDIITSLMPFQDDLLFMGGDHTLWVMRGDPAAGGAIDNISRQIGVVGSEAWTFDTTGNLYFFGSNGLYRISSSGGQIEHISRDRMDALFGDIDTSTNAIRLVYDREWQGVHIFITPVTQAASPTDHYFWDERSDSFWRDQYPTNVGPTTVHLFDADNPDNRAVLLGGFDGYIRCFDEDAMTDDGTAISSSVLFTPKRLVGDLGDTRISEIQMVLAAGSGSPTLQVFAEQTPEAVSKETTPRYATTLSAGRNRSIRHRAAGNALMFKLSHSTSGATWAYESGMAIMEPIGKTRRRAR